MSAGADALAEARRWIGTPYRHQASVRGAGADCLGLVRGVWRALCGAEPVAVPVYTADWSEVSGEEALWQAAAAHLVPLGEGEPAEGEVILFRMREAAVAKHLGIATGPGEAPGGRPGFVHAYSGLGVVESALSAPWRRRLVARFAFPSGG